MTHDHECSEKGCHCHHHCCGGCHEQHSQAEHEDFAHELLKMADDVWMEVLKEKIKHKVENLSGSHLDKLATLVAESNHTRWQNKLASQKFAGEFKDKIAAFFS